MNRPQTVVASLETEVPVRRSLDQIRDLVEKYGANHFGIDYDPITGFPIRVTFRIRDRELGDALPVRLEAPVATIFARIRRARSRWGDAQVQAQAQRVAWRNLHDFVRASLIAVDTGIMTLGEAFMASLLVTLPDGETKRFGELAAEAGGSLLRAEGGQLRLGRGS